MSVARGCCILLALAAVIGEKGGSAHPGAHPGHAVPLPTVQTPATETTTTQATTTNQETTELHSRATPTTQSTPTTTGKSSSSLDSFIHNAGLLWTDIKRVFGQIRAKNEEGEKEGHDHHGGVNAGHSHYTLDDPKLQHDTGELLEDLGKVFSDMAEFWERFKKNKTNTNDKPSTEHASTQTTETGIETTPQTSNEVKAILDATREFVRELFKSVGYVVVVMRDHPAVEPVVTVETIDPGALNAGKPDLKPDNRPVYIPEHKPKPDYRPHTTTEDPDYGGAETDDYENFFGTDYDDDRLRRPKHSKSVKKTTSQEPGSETQAPKEPATEEPVSKERSADVQPVAEESVSDAQRSEEKSPEELVSKERSADVEVTGDESAGKERAAESEPVSEDTSPKEHDADETGSKERAAEVEPVSTEPPAEERKGNERSADVEPPVTREVQKSQWDSEKSDAEESGTDEKRTESESGSEEPGSAARDETESSTDSTQEGRIIGGSPAKLGQFPWQVAIKLNGNFRCGGAVIDTRWVITAGHCVEGVTVGRRLEVVVGSLTSNPGHSYFTKAIHLHEDYTDQDDILLANDIALLQFADDIEFNDDVQPVRLPRRAQQSELLVGETVVIAGWGKTHDANTGASNKLLYVDLPVISNAECSEVLGDTPKILDTNLCVAAKKNRATCNGDSGGPLVWREEDGLYTLVGVVSFGVSDGCEAGLPNVFTRVTSYLDWIGRRSGMDIFR